MITGSVLGVAIGAIFGGKIIASGRRRTIFTYNVVSILGSLISLVPNLYAIVIGRLIFGFGAGVLVTACPKIVEETVPAHYMDYGFGISTNLAINTCVMINFLVGLLLPPLDDIKAFENT